jgi:glutamyl endopeptidase
MSKSASQAVTTGPHASVSNQPEAEPGTEAVGKPVSEPPSEGENPGTSQIDDGTEAVPGFGRTERALDDMSSLFVAPSTSQLRDIGEASFGPPPPSAETVHGPDDRVQITNTSVYPWRVHASLLVTAADNSMWIGTGWFIGPHTLITAGHVVHIKNSGVPGRDGW